MDPVAFARDLIDIDSTTGREGDAGRFIAGRLRELGFSVIEQPVDGDRANVIATAGPASTPTVMLSTHFDCVPPFFPSRIEGDRLYGRGACDAKGILAAQVAAAERLRLQGETRVGLLFVVGEERGSDGAKLGVAGTVRCRGGHVWIYCYGGTARGEQGVGTRWGGVVGAGAMHVSWCYQNGFVRVLYQGDWRTCGTVVCLEGRVMLVS